MAIRIIKDSISLVELKDVAQKQFGDLVKAVVDVEKKIMAIGGGLHADEEVELMEKEGSERENTWGINLYPDKTGEEFVEFDSMINLKPAFGNKTRGVEDETLKSKIIEIVQKLVSK
jgi:hypothetical protein